MIASELLHNLAKEIISAMQRDTEDNTGELSKSITSNVVNDATGVEMSIAMLAYGQYVDTGTRGTENGNPNRKMPPIDALNSWAKKRGLNVWAVAKNIQKFGTKPHPFVHNFEDIINNNIDKISEALGIEIEDKIYKALLDNGTNFN